MTGVAALLAIAAFALFGLATEGHHGRRLHMPLRRSKQRRMRGAAWVLVAAAFPAALAAQGPVFGPVLWAGSLMLGAGIVFLALNLLPDRRR